MKPSIIIAISIMLMIVLLSLVRSKKKSAETPEIVKALLDFVEKNGSLFTQFDHLTNIVIGYSQADLQLFFLKIINEKRVFSQIDLSGIQKISLIKNTRKTNSGDSVVDSISIVFSQKDKGKHPISLEFYNLETDGFTFFGELDLAEKWGNIISDLIAVK